MCCKSKKKPVATTTNTQIGQTTTVPVVPATGTATTYYPPATQQVISSKLPKSTISFSAHDYDYQPLNNQSAFIPTKRATHFAEDRGDRLEDYAHETTNATQSKLIQPKQILTYDLDQGDGVSRTPIVNTFHYQSQLNHCFLNYYNPDHYKDRASIYPASRNTNYQSQYNSAYQNQNGINSSQTRPLVTDSAMINQGVYQSGVRAADQNSGISGTRY